MNFLPVSLNISGKKILVVGGGRAALKKIKTLIQYTHDISVCAPRVIAKIRDMPIAIIERPYEEKFLADVYLVYACTNESALNLKIKADAARRKILTCVADNTGECDFISPAIHKSGCISVAVSSNGKDVKRAIELRDRIKEVISKPPR